MNAETEKYLDYIRDLAYLLREQAAEAHTKAKAKKSEFEEGREFGLREALAWMQHQADVFDLPRDRIYLADFDAMTSDVQPPAPHSPEEGE